MKERSIAAKGTTAFKSNTEKEKIQITVNVVPGGFPVLLFLIFLVLKLTENVAWSWLWVTSPLWIVVVLSMITAVVIALKKSD